jgi:hypothetical protein
MTTSTHDMPGWFTAQLAETVEWCQGRVDLSDPERCLRSPKLRPQLGPHDGTATALWVNPEMVEGVVQRRRQLLAERGWLGSNELPVLRGGQLLLCAYEYTNHNGATAAETSGFLDDHDVPPWDTWIGEVAGLPGSDPPGTWGGTGPPTLMSALSLGTRPPHSGMLVCWIPSVFIDVVQGGLTPNASACFVGSASRSKAAVQARGSIGWFPNGSFSSVQKHEPPNDTALQPAALLKLTRRAACATCRGERRWRGERRIPRALWPGIPRVATIQATAVCVSTCPESGG